MAVLRDQRGGAERGGRAQDSADVVRVGHLVEYHHRPARVGVEYFVEVQLIERLALEHQALMRRVACDQAREVGNLGEFEREVRRQLAVERGKAFARRP